MKLVHANVCKLAHPQSNNGGRVSYKLQYVATRTRGPSVEPVIRLLTKLSGQSRAPAPHQPTANLLGRPILLVIP